MPARPAALDARVDGAWFGGARCRHGLGSVALGSVGLRRSSGFFSKSLSKSLPIFSTSSRTSFERIVVLDVVRQVVDLLLQVGHFGFAHRFLKLVLEIGGHAADLARLLPERAHDAGQFLRPDHDQRHDADEQEFGPTDVEHESYLRRHRPTPRPPIRNIAAATGARASEPRARGQQIWTSLSLDLALGLGAPLDRRRPDGRWSSSARPLGSCRSGFGGLVVGHALLEGFDALGDVAHHVGNLAAPAEYNEHERRRRSTSARCSDEPMKSSVRRTLSTAHIWRISSWRLRGGHMPILARN